MTLKNRLKRLEQACQALAKAPGLADLLKPRKIDYRLGVGPAELEPPDAIPARLINLLPPGCADPDELARGKQQEKRQDERS